MEEPPGFLGRLCAGGEGGIPGFLVGQGAARPHQGHCPTPKCLWDLPGPSCPNPMKNHLEPLCQGRQNLFQRLPREDLVSCHSFLPLAWNSFQWPGPAAPLGAVDGRTQGVGPGVSPAPCPRFWGHCVTSVVFRNDSHPHTGCLCRAQGRWNGVIGLPGGILLEPGM